MCFKTSHILLPAIKIYGLSANLYEPLIALIGDAQVDILTLAYTLSIESLFIYVKSAHIEVPTWAELLQDLF
ncbi:MAG: hypothetical protein WBN13_12520 [Robiginitalea sp.]|jgi:hypothetical protein|uniref:hypothetical protein n=1 Tax=Robiginitalea sp. TaxID=1902411 RepID=UPI003C71041B